MKCQKGVALTHCKKPANPHGSKASDTSDGSKRGVREKTKLARQS
jgi:hypothetical protein